VEVGSDCVIDVNVVLEGPMVLGRNVRIGANCCLRRVQIGDDVEIRSNSVIEEAVVGKHARIGPFARVRPGTRVGEAVQVGNFVEIKNSHLESGAKVNHLSYVGDSSIGAHSNIGAGVITCNYDGARKHRTTIGDDAFIGSDSQLVAPVRIGNGATVGAGSTITQDVPDNALAVSRSRQRNIAGWKRPSED
jgi:bifunctional UDP-N-acetylglucosamine pyrophosphorylase/glucosamine-1-phosphate N-acetyltransferase